MTELSIVIPAHDEEATIDLVVRDAVAAGQRLAPGSFEVVVVDDGSNDRTPDLLDGLAAELAEVEVVHQRPNRGHGPSLLAGLDRARGAWLAHLDSDDQIAADQLDLLWSRRDGADLVLGVRARRHDPAHRLVITRVLRVLVGRLAGRPIADANVPCKLVRRELWDGVRPRIADDTFAPSIALAVLAARRPARIVEVVVEHRARTHGRSSLRPVRLARALGTATRQTVGVARRA